MSSWVCLRGEGFGAFSCMASMAAHSEGQQRQQRRQLARAARCVPMLQAMTILSSPHLMLAMTPRQAELSGPLRSCRAARVGRVRGPPGQRLVAHQVPGWSDGLHHNAGVCVWRGWGVGVGWGALVDVWVGWARKLCCQPRAAPVGPQLQLCCHILLCCASPATPALPTISRLARGVLEVLLRCQTLCAAASVCNIVSPFHCTHPSTRPAPGVRRLPSLTLHATHHPCRTAPTLPVGSSPPSLPVVQQASPCCAHPMTGTARPRCQQPGVRRLPSLTLHATHHPCRTAPTLPVGSSPPSLPVVQQASPCCAHPMTGTARPPGASNQACAACPA